MKKSDVSAIMSELGKRSWKARRKNRRALDNLGKAGRKGALKRWRKISTGRLENA